MPLRLGADARIFLNVSIDVDPWNNPDWAEATNCRDLSLDDTMDEADATTRGTNKTKMAEPTLRANGLDFEILEDTGDGFYLALEAAYLARTPVDVVFASGDLMDDSDTFVRAEYKVLKFSETQALGDITKRAVSIKPHYDTTHLPQRGIIFAFPVPLF